MEGQIFWLTLVVAGWLGLIAYKLDSILGEVRAIREQGEKI